MWLLTRRLYDSCTELDGEVSCWKTKICIQVLFKPLNLGKHAAVTHGLRIAQSYGPVESLAGWVLWPPGNSFTQHQVRFIYEPTLTFCFQFLHALFPVTKILPYTPASITEFLPHNSDSKRDKSFHLCPCQVSQELKSHPWSLIPV